jgi:YVTN family beta-propeller protein
VRHILLIGLIATTLSFSSSPAQAADGPSVAAAITVGTAPWGVAFSPDGALAYVGNSGSNTLSVIDVAARTTTTVSGGVLNASAPAGVAVKPDGSKVLFTAYAVQGTLGMSASDLSLSEVNVGCVNPLPITMASDGLTAYVGCGSGSIQAVDTATLAASNVRAETGQIDDIAYVPKGSKSSDDIAYLLNVVSGSPAGYFRLSNGVGSTATLPGFGLSLAVDTTGTRAYVGDSTGVLSVFEISNPTVPLHTISVGGQLRGIALSADGALAYVTDKAGNRVKVVDLATRSVTHTVDVGIGPQRIAISPDGRTALVTNNGSTTVSLLTLMPEPALTPVFDAPVSTESGYTVNVTNYDAHYTWTPTVNTGSITAGTPTDATVPLTITGLAAGATATATMNTARTGYSSGSATVSGTAQTGTALTPVFAAPVATPSGFTVNVTNYDAAYTWTPSVGVGAVTAGAPAGPVLPLTVTGLNAGQSATVTMGTARVGYVDGAATVRGTAAPAPRPPAPGPTAQPSPGTSPQPAPTAPLAPIERRPSAPMDIEVAVGDGRAVLTWLPPASAGSGSQMSYIVEANPGGEVCITTQTSCTVEGLVNGMTYTFAVRASNDVGFGPWSAATAAVTPAVKAPPRILLRGTKKQVRGKPGVLLHGVSTGLPAGTEVQPWLRFDGKKKFIRGSARIRVDESGSFQWQRRVTKGVKVVVRTRDGNVRSNTISLKP